MQATADIEPLLLTVPQAAKRLNLGRSTVYELMKSGALRYVKIGDSRRIASADVEEYVARLLRNANT